MTSFPRTLLTILLCLFWPISLAAQDRIPLGVGGGGLMAGLSFSPFDPDTWLIGTDMGYLMRTTDGGENWDIIDQHQIIVPSKTVFSVPIGFGQTKNGRKTFLYTLKPPSALREPHPYRKSTDYDKWRPQHNIEGSYAWPAIEGLKHPVHYWVSNIPNPTRVLAATENGLLESNNGGISGSWSETPIDQTSGKPIGTFIGAKDTIWHGTTGRLLRVDRTPGKPPTPTILEWPGSGPGRPIAFAGGADRYGTRLAVLVEEEGACKTFHTQMIETNACPNLSGLNGGDELFDEWTIIDKHKDGNDNDEPVTCARLYVKWIPANGVETGWIASGYVGAQIAMAQNDPHRLYLTGQSTWTTGLGTAVWSFDKHDLSPANLEASVTKWMKPPSLQQNDKDSRPCLPADRLERSSEVLDYGYTDGGFQNLAVNAANSAVVGGSGHRNLIVSKNSGKTWSQPVAKLVELGTGELNCDLNGPSPIPGSKAGRGSKWSSIGLEVTSVNRVRFHPENPDMIVLAGNDQRFLLSRDGGDTWRSITPRDSTDETVCGKTPRWNAANDLRFVFEQIDPKDPNRTWMVAAISPEHDALFKNRAISNNLPINVNRGGVFYLAPDKIEWSCKHPHECRMPEWKKLGKWPSPSPDAKYFWRDSTFSPWSVLSLAYAPDPDGDGEAQAALYAGTHGAGVFRLSPIVAEGRWEPVNDGLMRPPESKAKPEISACLGDGGVVEPTMIQQLEWDPVGQQLFALRPGTSYRDLKLVSRAKENWCTNFTACKSTMCDWPTENWTDCRRTGVYVLRPNDKDPGYKKSAWKHLRAGDSTPCSGETPVAHPRRALRSFALLREGGKDAPVSHILMTDEKVNAEDFKMMGLWLASLGEGGGTPRWSRPFPASHGRHVTVVHGPDAPRRIYFAGKDEDYLSPGQRNPEHDHPLGGPGAIFTDDIDAILGGRHTEARWYTNCRLRLHSQVSGTWPIPGDESRVIYSFDGGSAVVTRTPQSSDVWLPVGTGCDWIANVRTDFQPLPPPKDDPSKQ